MHNYKKLQVWQESIDFVYDIYQLTKSFPASEKFALTAQLHRAAISIPSNIAEGAGRKTEKDFCHFINISVGSTAEVETLLFIALKLNYINNETFEKTNHKLDTIQKKLNGLQKHLESKFIK